MPPFLARLLAWTPGSRKIDLKQLALAYQAIPQTALADLSDYCGAIKPAPHDRDAMIRHEGRRDVWLRIVGFRNVRDNEIVALQRGEQIATTQDQYHG